MTAFSASGAAAGEGMPSPRRSDSVAPGRELVSAGARIPSDGVRDEPLRAVELKDGLS